MRVSDHLADDRLAAVGLMLAMAACGGADAAPGGGRASGLDSPDFAISPTAETVYTVGALEGEPWETFGSVTSVAFDAEGYLYILDRDAAHVVVIDPQGAHERTISNKGEGPGELSAPFGMVVLSDGRLAVFDFAKQGFQVFDRAGEYLESVTFNPQDGMPGARLWALPDDGIVSTSGMRVRMGPDGPMDEPEGRPIDRFSLEGGREVLYTAWRGPPPEEGPEREVAAGNMRVQMRMPLMRAFEPQLQLGVLTDGRVAVVDSIGYRVKLVDPSGTVVGALERPIVPIVVTPQIQSAERERRLSELEEGGSSGNMVMIARDGGGRSGGGNITMGGDAMRDMMEGRINTMIFADEIPAIANMAVDWNDRIWVQRSMAPGETGPTDILTADGQYLGTIGPDGLRIPAAFGPDGLMAYIESDELEVQRVRVARLADDEALEGAR